MKKCSRGNKFSGGGLVCSLVGLLAAAPAVAQEGPILEPPGTTAESSTHLGVTAVDTGKLIGEDVVDAEGNTVGEIESVIVDPGGKVTSVVLNIGSWLESDKRISLPWKDLKADADGKIRTGLTKESAQAAAAYAYSDAVNRGKVLNEAGQVYAADGTQEPPNASVTARRDDLGEVAQNADGSLNVSKVVGLSVVNNANDSIGRIAELLLDPSGKVSGVVVDVGGFLGIGTHPVKLAWNQIRLVKTDGALEAVIDLDKNALKQMPEYKAASSG